MPRRSLALFLLSLAACSRPAPAPQADGATPDTSYALGLERGPCFGACPMYALEIQGDGSGVLKATSAGQNFHQSFQVAPAQVLATVALADSLGFFRIDTAIAQNPALCGRMATDHPSSHIMVRLGKRQHEVEYYHGCYGPAGDGEVPLPDKLVALQRIEAAIDSLGKVGQWVDSLRGRR